MTAPGLGLGGALAALRDVLAGARYPLRVPHAAEAGKLAQATLAQLVEAVRSAYRDAKAALKAAAS